MSTTYHPRVVANWAIDHGFDVTTRSGRQECAEEYVRSGKAPAGMAASTIAWHLEHHVQGKQVGVYLPDGTIDVTSSPRTVLIDVEQYRNAASALRSEIESELAKNEEDISEAYQGLVENLASAKTLEALFSMLAGDYSPPNGTLLHSLMTDVKEN